MLLEHPIGQANDAADDDAGNFVPGDHGHSDGSVGGLRGEKAV
jgi:hypothetical protein